jgi:hypothetical protein
MTPCASLRIEAGTRTESRTIVINIQNSGNNTTNHSHSTSSKIKRTQNIMEGIENTLRILEFYVVRS